MGRWARLLTEQAASGMVGRPVFKTPVSSESCPLVEVVPHPFHQLGKARRPGKGGRPDGW